MTIDPGSLSSLALVGVGFTGAFLVALWISLIIWTYRDMRSRSRDRLLRLLAVLLVGVLFLPGVLVYLVLRPGKTLDEEYQRSLEEEAMLQTLEDLPVCPGCSRRVENDWLACPSCHTRLKKRCHQCGKLMELSWNLCPYCATPAPGMRRDSTIDEAIPPSSPDDMS